MKKALLIGYSFNITRSGGSVRQRGLAKYLSQFGWDLVVLTPKSDEPQNSCFNIIETPYDEFLTKWTGLINNQKVNPEKKDELKVESDYNVHNQILKNNFMKYFAKLALDSAYELFAYPDAQKGWFEYAIEKGNEILESDNFSAIISSSKPVTSHLIACELKKKHEIPWVADFRDLWTQNHYYPYSPLRKYIESRLELNTIKSADALVTVSKPLEDLLKEKHKGKRVYTVLNGFDPEQISQRTDLDSKFTITYTGILYNGKRSPEILFKALHELIIEKKINTDEIEVNFYGPYENWLKKEIIKYELQGIAIPRGSVSREESIEKQRKSQILLLLTWNDPSEKGVVTGKIFDYLAAKRPIVFIGARGGVIEEILEKTSAGVSLSTVAETKIEIMKAYNDFKLNHRVTYNGISREIDKYSHEGMAKKFALILDNSITDAPRK